MSIQAKKNRLSVLMIDDSPKDAELISNMLENIPEYRVDFSYLENPEDAYLELYSGNYELTFVDFWYGGEKTGTNLVNELRKSGYSGLIFLLTGKASPEDIELFIESGGDGAIDKNRLEPGLLRKLLSKFEQFKGI